MAERKKQSVLNGALILAIGMLGVKLIGMLFKMPLADMIGVSGRGYFDSAYNIYTPVFAISMAGLPVAIARMVAEDVALHRYREARRVFAVGKRLYLIIGTVGMLALFLAAYPYALYLEDILKMPAIFAIAPSIFFCCYMSVHRGYYEGLRNMTPTAISQIIEASGKLVIGLTMAKMVLRYGEGIYKDALESGQTTVEIFGKAVSSETEAYLAIYPWSAAAAIVGVTAGSFFALMFLVVYHKIKGDSFTRAELAASPKPMEGSVIAKRLFVIAVPMMASSLILNVTNLIDTVMIQGRITHALETDFDTVEKIFHSAFSVAVENNRLDLKVIKDVANYLWGTYGTALDFRTLVPTITSSLGISALPALAAAWATKDRISAKNTVNTVLRFCLLIALPAGVGMAALAKPILTLIYGRGNSAEAIDNVSMIMMTYGLFTAFMAISTPITNMLQAIGRTDIPIRSLAVAASVKVALNYVLVGNPKLTIYGAVIGTVVFYLIIVASNLSSLLYITKVKIQITSVLLKPLLCALLCGATAWASYGLINRLLIQLAPSLERVAVVSATNIATGVAIGLAGIVYLVSLLLSRSVQKEEVLSLPKGESIAKILEKYRLLG